MPTLSNEELKQQIDKIFFSKYNALHDNFFKSEFEASKEAANDVLKLFATQNTALLKEVADTVIGADEFPVDQDEWHGEEEAKIIGADELRAVQRSKLAAMGVDDAK